MPGQTDVLFRAEFDASGAITGLQRVTQESEKASQQIVQQGAKSEQAATKTQSLSNSMMNLAKGVGGALVIRKLVAEMADATKAAIQAEESQARLAAVLRATGGTAGFTASQLSDFATELQNSTGISDEAIKNSMAILATFRSISGDTFKQATQLAVDLSAVFGTDLNSAATMLGKALEDPIQGLTALRRVGVTFTEAQKEQIQAFVEANEKAKAQAVILEALRVQVGGAAAAVSQSTGGMRQLGQVIGDAKEAFGGLILSALKTMGIIQGLTKVFSGLASVLNLITKGDQQRGWIEGRSAAELEKWVAGIKKRLEKEEQTYRAMEKNTEAANRQRTRVAQLRIQLRRLESALEAARKKEQTIAEATDTAAEKQKEAAKAATEQQRAIQQLIDRLHPAQRVARELAGDVELLAAAQRQGEITTEQLTEDIVALVEGADNAEGAYQGLTDALRQGSITSGVLADVLERLRQKLSPVPDEVSPIAREFSNLEYDISHLNPSLEEVTELFGDIPPPPAGWPQFFRDISSAMGPAVSDGILGTLQGDAFRDAWAGVWESLALISSTQLQDAVTKWLESGDLAQALQAGGFMTPEGKTDWRRVGQFLGGIIWAGGVAQQNRGQAALGGMISGAVSGASVGGWVGAIVGGVIGGIAGYFSVQDQRRRLALRFGGGRPSFLEAEGPTEEQEREMLRQLRSTYIGYRRAILSVFEAIGAIPEEVLQGLLNVRLEISERTRDISSLWQRILRGDLPRAMMADVTGPLEQALTELGVSTDRARQELGRLFSEDFSAALEALARYVGVLVGLRDISELLGDSLDHVRELATMDLREAFLATLDDTIERSKMLGQSLELLFSDEQVDRAEQMLQLATQQYENTLRYIAQLEQLSAGIAQSIDEAFFGFAEQRAREAGPEALAQFYRSRLGELQQEIAAATSPEQVQTLWQQFMQIAQRLWGLAGEAEGGPNEALRRWVEEQIQLTGGQAQELIRQWEEEAIERQQELREQVDLLREALAATAANFDELEGGAEDVGRRFEELGGDVENLGDGFRRLEAAVSSLIERFDALGGAVAINVSLDTGLAADVYGDADLVRLRRAAP